MAQKRPIANSPTKVFQSVMDCYENGNKMLVHSGGTSCFSPGTIVITKTGNKPIEKVSQNDSVLSYNEEAKKTEYRKVINTLSFSNTKRTIKVTLKSGDTITATEDHEFYHKGGWVSLKHLLSLRESQLKDK